MLRKFVFMLSVLTVFLGLDADARAQSSYFEVDANVPVYDRVFTLDEGTTYSWTVRNLSSGGDTVMRLFKYSPILGTPSKESYEEVAYNDDGGWDNASKISGFTPDTSGKYILVIHQFQWSTWGTADLDFNGQRLVDDFQFGGWWMYEGQVTDGDEIRTVFEPGGALNHQLIVLDSWAGGPASYYGDDRTASGHMGVKYTHSGANLEYPDVIVSSPDAWQKMSYAINAKAQVGDTDGDGLADDLEAQLGTCASTTGTTSLGWDCSTYDSTDTDNDGIDDYAEFFGVQQLRFVYSCSGPPFYICTHVPDHYDLIPFRLWGGSPTHKDIFVEVDWDETTTHTKIQSEFALRYLKKFADFFLEGSAQEYQNPDGQPGIWPHFDVKGGSTDDYGDVKALRFDGGGSGLTALDTNGNRLKCTPSPNQVNRRVDSMISTRQDYFRYFCIHQTFGKGGAAFVPSLSLYSVPYHGTYTHEAGHMLGLGHGGNESVNSKPNYYSLMNYSFPLSRTESNNYTRPPGFSHGTDGDLDPTALCERDGLNSSEPVDHLGREKNSAHEFLVDEVNHYIDWNLDGVFSPCTEPVRGALLFNNSKGGDAFLDGWQPLPMGRWGTGESNGGGSLAHATVSGEERLYAFYPSAQDDQISYFYGAFPGDCPADAFEGFSPSNGCTSWSSSPVSTSLAGIELSAANFTDSSGTESVFIAARTNSDVLRVYKVDFSSGSPSYTTEVSLLTPAPVGQPDIAAHDGNLYVVWRTGNNSIAATSMDASGTWTTTRYLTDSGGTQWTSGVDPVLAIEPNEDRLYLLRTTSNETLNFLYRSVSGDWVENTTKYAIADLEHRTEYRPALAWHAYDQESAPSGPGYWQMVARTEHLNPTKAWKVFTLGAGVEKSGRYGNAGMKERLELFYSPKNNHLLALHGSESLDFHPYADGITPRVLKDNNDFSYMAGGICWGFREEISGDSRPCGRLNAVESYYTGLCEGYHE